MNLLSDRYVFFVVTCCFLFTSVPVNRGHAATAPRPALAQESVQTSAALEEKGDIVNAVEELKIALTIDPRNTKAREELTRLLVKRDIQAENHLKAGNAIRTSNPAGARKEYLRSLRIRNDYPEALMALRGLQQTASIDSIHSRQKKEARIASSKAEERERAAEDDQSTGDYSLDIAISALEDGDFATAIREFEKMKVLYPKDPDIQAYLDKSWYNSGKASFIKMEYKKALHAFSKVRKGYENVADYITKCKQALKKAAGH